MDHPRSEPPRRPPHVLIIGAGLGGLCLAQGLTTAGIGVTVFERDDSPRTTGQGYRISLKPDGTRALRECLPEHLFGLCLAASLRQATRLTALDHRLNPLFGKPLPHLDEAAYFGINRLTLREILLTGLDGAVRFGATFRRLERLGDGRIRARFADGTHADGDLLVGADGTGSAVRPFVAPGAAFDELGTLLYGRTLVGEDVPGWVPEALVDAFATLTGPDGVSMTVATCRTRGPLPAGLTEIPGYLAWTISTGSAGSAGSAGSMGGRPGGTHPPDGSGGADRPERLDPAGLRRLALDLIRDRPAAVRRLVEEGEAPFPVRLRSARPVEPWHVPGVTLLGDAIHTMSPGRGEGANVVLRDAGLLRHALVFTARHGVPLETAVAEYESAMLRHGFAAVAASRERPFLRHP
ncbi:NAD(P)/FAD-dependent oxidoreductase [Streptosporangium sp. NPDC048047]|uniref:FAD-dependent oxidoreductase n=1 Tax=Streptosporangium sp. NPDC048047 TaxID=3155748 RepID=UPI00342C1E69